MRAYKIYKHLITTDLFNISTKISNFRKPTHANKNRKPKN